MALSLSPVSRIQLAWRGTSRWRFESVANLAQRFGEFSSLNHARKTRVELVRVSRWATSFGSTQESFSSNHNLKVA